MICFPFLRQFGAPNVFFPEAPACAWNCMEHLSSFSPSIWRPWRFLPWSPCLHLKLHGTPFVLFSDNLAPLTFSSLEPLLALETVGAPIVFFSINLPPWRFLPWSPCLHLKLHGTPLVLFSVNLAPLTFSSLEPLLALETAWRISRHFLRQFDAPDVFVPGAPTCTWNCRRPSRPFLRKFGAPDVFFPGAPACTWNCMAPLSSFSPSIWRSWRFLPWSPCLHLKLHGASLVVFSVNLTPLTFSSLEHLLALETVGAPLVLFSVNLAPLTFSSLEPLFALETAWRPSRPFLRQFGAPDVFFPGAPACTWNCMVPLSSFSPSIWRPWRFLPWSPCLHLKLHGSPLVLFSVNFALMTFSSLEPLLALETAYHPSPPFLRQFGVPDVFFPGAPACTWNCRCPSCRIDLNFFLFSFLLPLSSLFSFLFPSFPLFSSFLPLSFFPFPFFLSFWRPFGDPGGPGPPKPPQDTPLVTITYAR